MKPYVYIRVSIFSLLALPFTAVGQYSPLQLGMGTNAALYGSPGMQGAFPMQHQQGAAGGKGGPEQECTLYKQLLVSLLSNMQTSNSEGMARGLASSLLNALTMSGGGSMMPLLPPNPVGTSGAAGMLGINSMPSVMGINNPMGGMMGAHPMAMLQSLLARGMPGVAADVAGVPYNTNPVYSGAAPMLHYQNPYQGAPPAVMHPANAFGPPPAQAMPVQEL